MAYQAMPRTHSLHQEQWIPRNRNETFAFFEDAANLQEITPPSLHFQILTELPIEMRSGTIIDYRLKLLGVPFNWKTRITDYAPPIGFVDQQIQGPYHEWIHRHDFFESDEGTRMVDHVDYAIGWGVLGSISHRLFVEQMLQSIFDYRRRMIERLLA